MKPAVYLRVSSESQSVRSQHADIVTWLAGNGASEDGAAWYIDAGVSAKTLERPELDRLRRDIFLGKVDTVVLYKLDRLARRLYDGITLLHEWLEKGVRIVVVTMQIDLSGALGQTIAALLFGLAQMEREHIRERQAAGIAAARANGTTWGGRALGSVNKKTPVKKIRRLLGFGCTLAETARLCGVSPETVNRFKESEANHAT